MCKFVGIIDYIGKIKGINFMKRKIGTSDIKLNIFLAIAVVIGISAYFFDMYGVQGLYRMFLKGIFAICIGLILMCVGSAALKKLLAAIKEDKGRVQSIFAIVFLSILLPGAMFFVFRAGIRDISNSSSDLRTNNKANTFLVDCYVKEENNSKGGSTYYLKGNDLKNNGSTFEIDFNTYKTYKNKKGYILKIISYKKSRVIINIKELSAYQLIQGTLEEHMNKSSDNNADK